MVCRRGSEVVYMFQIRRDWYALMWFYKRNCNFLVLLLLLLLLLLMLILLLLLLKGQRSSGVLIPLIEAFSF